MKKEKEKDRTVHKGKTEKFKIERENRRENGQQKRDEERAKRVSRPVTKGEIGFCRAKLRRRRKREIKQ